MSQHGQTQAPPPPPGTQTCTDRLTGVHKTSMFAHSSTCTPIHAHQHSQMCTSAMCVCAHEGTRAGMHTPKSTCTHTGGLRAHAPPKMHTHEQTWTHTHRHSCPLLPTRVLPARGAGGCSPCSHCPPAALQSLRSRRNFKCIDP